MIRFVWWGNLRPLECFGGLVGIGSLGILFIGTGWSWVLQASIPCLSMVATARKRSICRVAGYFLLGAVVYAVGLLSTDTRRSSWALRSGIYLRLGGGFFYLALLFLELPGCWSSNYLRLRDGFCSSLPLTKLGFTWLW